MTPGIFPCNSVDVLGDDGLLRYGRVVDVADRGLYIDFLCPNRRREFTLFGRMFHNDDSRYLDRNDMARRYPVPQLPAEVLARESASGAWTWFPAELRIRTSDIGHSSYSVAVVHRGKPDEYADVIPMTRIRWKTSPTDRRTQVGYKYRRQSVDFPKQVEKGTFVTRCIPLSDWYPRELVTAALQQQNREVIPRFGHSAPAVGVEIVAGCVVYVVRRSDPGTEPDKAQLTRELEYINRLSTTLTNSVSRMREPKEQPKGMAKVAVLPTELWTEVFSYLDTVTQTKLRPVCPTWNILLDSPYLRARIILDSSAFTKVDPNYEPVYFMIAALFKCFKYAHYIAVVDPRSWISEAGVWEMFDVINFIAQRQNGSKLKAVFLRGLCFCLLDSFYHDHPTLHRYLSGASCTLENPGMIYRGLPCDNVHIKRCRIVLSCLDYGSDIILSVKIRVRHQRLTGDFAGGLWSALEAGLPAPGHTELRRLGTWLSLHTHGKQTSHARKCVAFVCKTLCATQTADPRPTLHYRGKEWCVDGLKGLKLKKLSRVAQDFLIQLMDALSP